MWLWKEKGMKKERERKGKKIKRKKGNREKGNDFFIKCDSQII
jgi:hypothetical protein